MPGAGSMIIECVVYVYQIVVLGWVHSHRQFVNTPIVVLAIVDHGVENGRVLFFGG